MIWVLLIVLFYVAMWLIGKLAKPTPPEPWTIQPEPGLAELRADDPTWKERVLEYCESPAESAFLKAMIAGCDLRPDLALVKGGGLSLTLQVKMPPYRADFLANDWLVIEIDGAAYHSSPESVASDQKRDEYLRTKGYSTIRIPAKVVFDDAREAVRRVRAAISEGPPEAVRRVREAMAVTAITKPSGWIASRAERVIAAGLAGSEACDDLREFLKAETDAIWHALRIAEITIDAEEYARETDPKTRAAGLASISCRQRMNETFNGPSPDRLAVLTRAVLKPPVHPDPEINKAIKRTYRDLFRWRELLLVQTRRKIEGNPRLSAALKAQLESMGYRVSWDAISGSSPRGSVLRA
jgi:very-short-patch-repair endonuclease